MGDISGWGGGNTSISRLRHLFRFIAKFCFKIFCGLTKFVYISCIFIFLLFCVLTRANNLIWVTRGYLKNLSQFSPAVLTEQAPVLILLQLAGTASSKPWFGSHNWQIWAKSAKIYFLTDHIFNLRRSDKKRPQHFI